MTPGRGEERKMRRGGGTGKGLVFVLVSVFVAEHEHQHEHEHEPLDRWHAPAILSAILAPVPT
jgi:hypothetical protein